MTEASGSMCPNCNTEELRYNPNTLLFYCPMNMPFYGCGFRYYLSPKGQRILDQLDRERKKDAG